MDKDPYGAGCRSRQACQVHAKAVRHFVKYKAHDEKNATKAGDVVTLMQSRPISKDKRWVIREVVGSNQGVN